MLKFWKKKPSGPLPEGAGKSSSSVSSSKGHGESEFGALDQLREAVESNNTSQVKKLLSGSPSLGSLPLDELGQTCLHLASVIGNLECVELLLKYADPNAVDSTGSTPLHLSVAHPEVVKRFLRKKSVDANRLAVQRNSLLHLLAKRLTPVDDEMWSLLKKVRSSLKIDTFCF